MIQPEKRLFSFKQNEKFLFLALQTVVFFSVCGCINTPFTPVETAEMTSAHSIREQNRIKSAYYEMDEMEKLQKAERPPYTIVPRDTFTIDIDGIVEAGPNIKSIEKAGSTAKAVKAGKAGKAGSTAKAAKAGKAGISAKAGKAGLIAKAEKAGITGISEKAAAAGFAGISAKAAKAGISAKAAKAAKAAKTGSTAKDGSSAKDATAKAGSSAEAATSDSVSHSVVVMPDGAIYLYPIGRVELAGLTVEEADQLLNQRFKEYFTDVKVTLTPVSTRQDSFTIIGMVNTPGIYTFTKYPTRLSDAVRMANNVPEVTENNKEMKTKLVLADFENAFLVRKGRILPLDFERALVARDPLYDIPVMDGDYIFIPSQISSGITVLGEVFVPRLVAYQPNITLLQVLALSGGVKETNSSIIRIIRKQETTSEVYHIDISKMQQGTSADFVLKPQDIVYVPKDPISEWNAIVKQLMPSAQFLLTLSGPFGNPGSFIYR